MLCQIVTKGSMFNEYRKLLSWSEIKKLNSWEELQNLSSSQQIYFPVLSTLKALGHWQVWLAMLFLALCVYSGTKNRHHFGNEVWNLQSSRSVWVYNWRRHFQYCYFLRGKKGFV